MNQKNNKATIGCLSFLIIIAFVTSYLTTKSFNPFTVYSSGNIAAIIIISLIAILMTLFLFQFLFLSLFRKYITIGTRQHADDIICPGCGLPLIQYMSSHGTPIRCPKCKKSWHNGPACYNKDMEKQVITIPTYFCPHCRSSISSESDISNMDDLM